MPHDKNGTLVQVGHLVRYTNWLGERKVSEVAKVTPGNQTCNVEVLEIYQQPAVRINTVTAKDVEVIPVA